MPGIKPRPVCFVDQQYSSIPRATRQAILPYDLLDKDLPYTRQFQGTLVPFVGILTYVRLLTFH